MLQDIYGDAVVEEIRVSWLTVWRWALTDRLRRERESFWFAAAGLVPHQLARWVLVRMTVATMDGDQHPDTMTYPIISRRWDELHAGKEERR